VPILPPSIPGDKLISNKGFASKGVFRIPDDVVDGGPREAKVIHE
jgi:hypothetical protein